MVVIQSVTSTSDYSDFLQFPYDLNRNNRNWIPPLYRSEADRILPKRNCFWETNPHRFFLAKDQEQIVGRIAAIVPLEHNAYYKTADGFFGFLEAKPEAEIFRKLFAEAETFLAGKHCHRVIGPFHPTIHHELGIVVAGFNEPSYYMLPQNDCYYDPLIQLSGYRPLRDFYSYKMNVKAFQKTPLISRWKPNINITVRHPQKSDFVNELKIFFDIYNDAFADHWGFSPISWSDFFYLAKDLKFLLDPELVFIAETSGEAIGFLLAVPNLNELLREIPDGRLFPSGLYKLLFRRKSIRTLRVITVAVKRGYQRLGVGSVFYPALARKAEEKGFTEAELSWVAENNIVMNKIANRVGAKRNKTYRLYERNL
jgi:GNAT superfamily N-acetyltransferase